MNADGRRIDRRDAERMLDAVSARSRSDPRPCDAAERPADPLVRLLEAAAAPATEAELAGEEAAVTAFRVLSAGSPRPAVPRLRPLPLVVTALATLVAALVTLTSVTGMPPTGWWASSGRGSAERAPSGPRDPGPSASLPTRPVPSVPASPRPEAVRLCRTYTAAAAADPQAARRGPAFTALAAQAGGGDKVPGYCTQVLKAADRNTPSDDDTPGAKGPKDNPGQGKGKGRGNGNGADDNPGNGDPPDNPGNGGPPENPGNGDLPENKPSNPGKPDQIPAPKSRGEPRNGPPGQNG